MRHDNSFGGPTTVGLSALRCALVVTPGRIVSDSVNEPSCGSTFFMQRSSPGSANPELHEDSGLTKAIGSQRNCLIEPTPISAFGIIGFELRGSVL